MAAGHDTRGEVAEKNVGGRCSSGSGRGDGGREAPTLVKTVESRKKNSNSCILGTMRLRCCLVGLYYMTLCLEVLAA